MFSPCFVLLSEVYPFAGAVFSFADIVFYRSVIYLGRRIVLEGIRLTPDLRFVFRKALIRLDDAFDGFFFRFCRNRIFGDFGAFLRHGFLLRRHNTVVKGDATYMSIAAASILAKTYRDDYMMRLAEEYPMYDWQSNKGYPTAKHRAAIRQHGTTPYHRMSFNLLGEEPKQLELSFE